MPAFQKKLSTNHVTKTKEILYTGQVKILVMDDQQEVRDPAGVMLQFLGYEVDFARDVDEAIALYKKAKESGKAFDAVILALTVPGGVSGKETLGKLHTIDPGVTAIVSSGYSDDIIMSEYRGKALGQSLPSPMK